MNKIKSVLHQSDIFLPKILQPIWFTKCLIDTLRYTGIRRGQLLKLTISNIDLERSLIIIPSHINKTHTYHKIPIPRKIYSQLEKLIQEMKKRNQKNTDQLFNINIFSRQTSRKKQVMNNDQLSYMFKIISKEVGFYVSPHRFRHTLATELMREPKNIYITKQLLGHKSLKTTLSYIHYDPESLRGVLDAL